METLFCNPLQDKRLLPAITLFGSGSAVLRKGPRIVNLRTQELRYEEDVVACFRCRQESTKGCRPHRAKVVDERARCRVAVSNVHLDAPRVSDSSVDKADPLQNGRDEFELCLEASVDHLQSGVPVREVAVKAQFRKSLDELNGAPQVLKNGGSMRLDIQRNMIFLRGI